MTKRAAWFVLLACTAGAFPAVGAERPSLESLSGSRRTFQHEGQTNGAWAAWVDSYLRNPMARALWYTHNLYLRGPSTNAPRLVLNDMSQGSHLPFWLGPDGLLAFEPRVGPPRLAFPGTNDPIMLQGPQPTNTNRIYRRLHWSADHYWFSNGALLYESHNGYAGADYVLGYFLLDTTNKTVTGSGICVELNRPPRFEEKNAEHPGDTSPMVCRDQIAFVGTHILWMNAGWPHAVHAKTSPQHWRTPQLRAFELESKRLMSGDEIPAALLAKHKEVVERISRKPY